MLRRQVMGATIKQGEKLETGKCNRQKLDNEASSCPYAQWK